MLVQPRASPLLAVFLYLELMSRCVICSSRLKTMPTAVHHPHCASLPSASGCTMRGLDKTSITDTTNRLKRSIKMIHYTIFTIQAPSTSCVRKGVSKSIVKHGHLFGFYPLLAKKGSFSNSSNRIKASDHRASRLISTRDAWTVSFLSDVRDNCMRFASVSVGECLNLSYDVYPM